MSHTPVPAGSVGSAPSNDERALLGAIDGSGNVANIDKDASGIVTHDTVAGGLLATIDEDTGDLRNAVATHDSAKPTKGFIGLGVAETTVPAAVSDGDAVQPWIDEYGRSVGHGSNLSDGSVNVTPVAPAPMASGSAAITQLTAPGATAAVDVSEYSQFGYVVTIAAINTNVVLEIQGSIGGTNYGTAPLANTAVANLAITNNQATITANGTYIIYTEAPIRYMKLNFVSESGGTASTIDGYWFARRK